MDEIRLAITSPNNVVYKGIMLRKFFYMIFIDANGRRLYAYIATVFGGLTEKIEKPEDAYKSIKYKENQQCALIFEFSSEGDIIESIHKENITNSYFRQRGQIENVWDKCEQLKNQEEVNNALKELYEDLYGSSRQATINVSDNQIIRITDKQNKVSHNCIVTKGSYDPGDSDSKYTLSCPVPSSDDCYDGLEAMNWIKVVIDLKRNILEERVLFSILLEKDRIFTPDFTWYFAPPDGHVISADSYVRIGNDRVNNAIQGVSDETTVFFNEWTDPPESISERKKSRVLFRSDEIKKVVDPAKLSAKEKVSVSIQLENPQKPSNRQFLYGLFIAFLLSFCSDKTRINDYYACLSVGCDCAEGVCYCKAVCNGITIVAPVLLLVGFLAIVLEPRRALPAVVHGRGKKSLLFWSGIRLFGIVSTALLILYVYGLWLIIPDIMRKFISCSQNKEILIICAAASLSTNLIYVIYCLLYLKRKIYNYIQIKHQ